MEDFMKKLICSLFLICLVVSLFSQEAVQTKLANLGIKASTLTNTPTKNILKIYTFSENNINGGIIVFTLKEIKTDVFATIVKSGSEYIVMSIEPVNANAYGKSTMKQLNGSFSRWNNTQEKNIPDAVSSATKHSSGIYKEIQTAVAEGITYMKGK
jgi:hypothetical protein